MSISRPILINDDGDFNPNNKMSLTHNLKTINTFNVSKFNDNFDINLNGIEFATIPSSKTELKFNDIDYEFSKLIITNDFDTYNTDTVSIDPSYAIIMEFNKINTENYKLYITIPIIDNISSNETLNYIIGYLDDSNVIDDISNGDNVICNIPNSNLNDLIPNTDFIFYSLKSASNDIQNHILINSDNSTLSIDYNTINNIKNINSTIIGNNTTKNGISTTDTVIIKVTKPIKNEEMLKTNQYDDIYIDCSPIEGNNTEIVKEKVLKLETSPIMKKTGPLIFSILALLLFFIILYYLFSNIGHVIKMFSSISGLSGLSSNTSRVIQNMSGLNNLNNMFILFVFGFLLYLYFDSFIRIKIKRTDNFGMKLSVFIISIVCSLLLIMRLYKENIIPNNLYKFYFIFSIGLSALVVALYTFYFNFIIGSFDLKRKTIRKFKTNYMFTIILIILLIFNVSSTESSANFLNQMFNINTN